MQIITSETAPPIGLEAHAVRAYWQASCLEEYDTGRVELALGPGDAATVAGDICGIEPTIRMSLQPLFIEEAYRQRGAATRLMSTLAHVAVKANVDDLCVSAESEHTLRILHKLFGEERLDYIDEVPDGNGGFKKAPWSLSTEAAISNLESFLTPEEKDKNPICVNVNLRGLDPDKYESPLYVANHHLIPDFSLPEPFLPERTV